MLFKCSAQDSPFHSLLWEKIIWQTEENIQARVQSFLAASPLNTVNPGSSPFKVEKKQAVTGDVRPKHQERKVIPQKWLKEHTTAQTTINHLLSHLRKSLPQQPPENQPKNESILSISTDRLNRRRAHEDIFYITRIYIVWSNWHQIVK